MNRITTSLVLLAVMSPATAAETLKIDPSHTAVTFSWNHRGLSHPVARLEQIEGQINLDSAHLSRSSVAVTLSMDGLRTGVAALDRRLKGEEFFAAGRFPVVSFSSTKVLPTGGQTFLLTGTLTVHGIARTVILKGRLNGIVRSADHGVSVGFDADTRLRRSDFGLVRYVPMTGDEIVVHITVEANGPASPAG